MPRKRKRGGKKKTKKGSKIGKLFYFDKYGIRRPYKKKKK